VKKGDRLIIFICVALMVAMGVSMVTGNAEPRVHTPGAAGRSYEGDRTEKKTQREKGTDPQGPTVLTEEQLGELMRANIPENFPLSELSLTLKEGTICLAGKTQKTALLSFLQAKGLNLPKTVSAAIGFLPEELTMEAELSASCDSHTGLLLFDCEEARLNGVALPDSLPAGLVTGPVTDAINQALCESGLYFTSLVVGDGTLTLLTGQTMEKGEAPAWN